MDNSLKNKYSTTERGMGILSRVTQLIGCFPQVFQLVRLVQSMFSKLCGLCFSAPLFPVQMFGLMHVPR